MVVGAPLGKTTMKLADGSSETFGLAQARRVAAMLEIEPQSLSLNDPVPRGWHFAMFAGQTPRHDLRSDGFPGLGVAMPQLDLPRLLLGSRKMAFQADLFIGAPVHRQSALSSIVEKTGRNGPLSIVKVDHSLTPVDATSPAVTEQQTYYLASLAPPGTPLGAKPAPPSLPPGKSIVVTPDEVTLFQYSALGFNTHRIHFDRDYARGVEGHPDLVVNGGLATLLATEFLRRDLSLMLTSLSARHLAPLYVGRPLTILLQRLATGQGSIFILDGDGIVAAELAVTFDEL
jgi:3-methylfumaryl-CoA hydratase